MQHLRAPSGHRAQILRKNSGSTANVKIPAVALLLLLIGLRERGGRQE